MVTLYRTGALSVGVLITTGGHLSQNSGRPSHGYTSPVLLREHIKVEKIKNIKNA